MSVEIKRTNNKSITVETVAASGSRVMVDHFMWMARELQVAIDEGMPARTTEVIIRNESGVNGVHMFARAVLTQEIP